MGEDDGPVAAKACAPGLPDGLAPSPVEARQEVPGGSGMVVVDDVQIVVQKEEREGRLGFDDGRAMPRLRGDTVLGERAEQCQCDARVHATEEVAAEPDVE